MVKSRGAPGPRCAAKRGNVPPVGVHPQVKEELLCQARMRWRLRTKEPTAAACRPRATLTGNRSRHITIIEGDESTTTWNPRSINIRAMGSAIRQPSVQDGPRESGHGRGRPVEPGLLLKPDRLRSRSNSARGGRRIDDSSSLRLRPPPRQRTQQGAAPGYAHGPMSLVCFRDVQKAYRSSRAPTMSRSSTSPVNVKARDLCPSAGCGKPASAGAPGSKRSRRGAGCS